MDEFHLLDALLRGERWAGLAIVSVYAPVLLGYADLLAPDLSTVDKEFAVEAAIERGIDHIDDYDSTKGSFGNWLRRLVHYAIADVRRRGPTTSELPIDWPEEPQPAPTTEQPDAAVDELRWALLRLALADQLIIALREFERLPYAQIAVRLDATEGACRVRHFRALKRLKRLLAENSAFDRYKEDGT